MQELSLQLNQVSPIKKTAAQDQKSFQASSNDGLPAANAFADMFKKQVNQQQTKPDIAPAANTQPAMKPAVANNRLAIAQANQTALSNKQLDNKQLANAQQAKTQRVKEGIAKAAESQENTATEGMEVEKVTAENQGIQDMVLMQLGLQVPVQMPQQGAIQVPVQAASSNAATTEPLANAARAIAGDATEHSTKNTALMTDLQSAAGDTDSATDSGKGTPNERSMNAEAAFGLNTAQNALALTEANSKEVLAEKLIKLQASAETAVPTSLVRPELNAIAHTASKMAQAVASTHQVTTAFGKADWNQAINQRVVYMLGAGEQTATLTLNPPNLGPLQVVIKVGNDHVDTTFISNNAEVRQALQDGLGMLKDKLNESGIQLGNANVSSQDQSQRDFQQLAQERAQASAIQAGTATDDEKVEITSPPLSVIRNGLVDTFA